MIPNAPKEAIDLISKLLTYDPKKRLNAKQVLEHPFLSELYDPVNDLGLKGGDPIKLFDFEFENYKLNEEIIRELLLDEIILSNSSDARKYNRVLRKANPEGILEKIYRRKDAKAEADNEVLPPVTRATSSFADMVKEQTCSSTSKVKAPPVKRQPGSKTTSCDNVAIAAKSFRPAKARSHEVEMKPGVGKQDHEMEMDKMII